MANLDGYNAEEYQPLDTFEPIPAGEYRAVATDSEMRSTKGGSGSYLQVVWELLEGDFKGRKLWSRLNLDNPNRTAVEIAQRELSSICRAAGILRPKDSAELHGIPVLLKVGVEKRSDTGELQNRIKGYAPIGNGAEKTHVAPTSAKPPWKR